MDAQMMLRASHMIDDVLCEGLHCCPSVAFPIGQGRKMMQFP